MATTATTVPLAHQQNLAFYGHKMPILIKSSGLKWQPAQLSRRQNYNFCALWDTDKLIRIEVRGSKVKVVARSKMVKMEGIQIDHSLSSTVF